MYSEFYLFCIIIAIAFHSVDQVRVHSPALIGCIDKQFVKCKIQFKKRKKKFK